MAYGIKIFDDSLRENQKTDDLATTKTYKWNQKYNDINGIIDDKEALKQTLEMMLLVERCVYPIYSNNYGREFDQLIGMNRHYVEAELKRLIPECLKKDQRVVDVINIEIQFKEDFAICNFDVISIYGSFQLEKEVEL